MPFREAEGDGEVVERGVCGGGEGLGDPVEGRGVGGGGGGEGGEAEEEVCGFSVGLLWVLGREEGLEEGFDGDGGLLRGFVWGS